MIGAGALQSVAVSEIELDKFNPRIRKFLEMYGGDPTAEQFFLALGAGGDEEGGATSTTFEKLKNSILTNGGVIQPVMLNRLNGGRLVCIDGNMRKALVFATRARGKLPQGSADWQRAADIIGVAAPLAAQQRR